MNKSDLISAMADKAGITKAQAGEALDGFMGATTDALKKGELYATNVPKSHGAKYPEHKRKILELIPQGGYWRDLPDEYQREYMGKSYHLGGGKTGMARKRGRKIF